MFILIVFVYAADEAGSTEERGSVILVYWHVNVYFDFCLNKHRKKLMWHSIPICDVIACMPIFSFF